MSDRLGSFDPGCRRCPRLSSHLQQVRRDFPDYHAAPVPPFGTEEPELLIVGLAPGMHGANATGRPFTGDFAGILLYRTLYEFGYASAGESRAIDDGLTLERCRITNAVKCLPPQNRPTTGEVNTCNSFLRNELQGLAHGTVVLALGGIAHRAVLRALGEKLSARPFGHGAVHRIPGAPILVDSYHCSRYNTQTGRLTPEMFRQVFHIIDTLLS